MADFEKVFQEHKDFIYKYLFKLCRDTDLAEELTQETFFRAYMNVSSLRDESKIPIWLCQIAKNTYFVQYNAQKKRAHIDEEKLIEACVDVEQSFIDKDLTEKALKCLHELDEPYKEVFMLAVLGQVPLKDISKMFGKSESWARVTFYRAKQKLTERMNEIYE